MNIRIVLFFVWKWTDVWICSQQYDFFSSRHFFVIRKTTDNDDDDGDADADDSDVADKDTTAAEDDVLIVSYSRYCRYRAAIRRLTDQTQSTTIIDALSTRLLAAIGLTADLSLPQPYTSAVRVLFCRSTVMHPALHKHVFRLDDLGTEL